MTEEKENIKQIILSIFMVTVILLGVVFIVKYEPKVNKGKVEVVDLESDLVSTDPKVSAVNFISSAGNMGDVDSLTFERIIEEGYGDNNVDRRLKALRSVQDAIVPGSPLINGRETKSNTEFASSSILETFFNIRNITISEPTDYGIITSFSDDGNVEYESVDVLADFESVRTTFQRPQDLGEDNFIRKVESSDKFIDVRITLVKSGELWFIYDVEESENLLNVRLATWSGLGVDTVNSEEVVVDEIIRTEGIQDE